MQNKKGMAAITINSNYIKITSKKNTPELISFKFGIIETKSNDNDSTSASSSAAVAASVVSSSNNKASQEIQITSIDQFYYQKLARLLKHLKCKLLSICKVLNLIN